MRCQSQGGMEQRNRIICKEPKYLQQDRPDEGCSLIGLTLQ